MPDPTLQGGFDLAFAEQAAFLRNKLDLPTETWQDLLHGAHDRAFVVAGATKADLLADLHAEVQMAIDDGTSLKKFRKDFRAIVAKHGWVDFTGSGTPGGFAWRTKVIYETNLRTSYAAGRYAQLTDPDFLAARPYWRYVHSDSVMHPRPLHQAWHGKVIRADDPWWQTHYPPNGWGCKCRVHALAPDQLGKYGKDAPDAAPHDGDTTWTDRNGNAITVPRGIDPGWAYAPGASLARELREIAGQKVARLPPPLGKSLAKDLISPAPAARVFKPQKTAAAAADWAVRNDLADFADYGGVKPEVANAWNQSLFEHLQEFPELRKKQKFVGTCQAQFSRWRALEIEKYLLRLKTANPGISESVLRAHAERIVKRKTVKASTWAHSWAQNDVSGVCVNQKWGKDVAAFENALKENVLANFHPPGCDSIRSVVDHEFGHQLDDLLGLHIDDAVRMAYNDARSLGIENEVSGYAKANIKEFIAECWAESLNNPAPRSFAQRIAGIVRARYSARFPRV